MLDKKSLGLLAGLLLSWTGPLHAQIVPGSGTELTELNDTFEDPNWTFTLNLPKASSNIDKVDRPPAGFASNGMWFESTYRGTPDYVKRVETPEGGLPGSQWSMAMQTKFSGVPGQISHKFQQDDLIANVSQKLGFMIPAAWTPSYVVRVYLPPFENWEQRIGSQFGFRADCQTIINKPTKMGRLFKTGGTSREMEQYWPGFFIQFNGKNHPQHQGQNTASLLMRSGERGEDITGPTITKPGWWTLGMTITPDGKVHYYGHEGVGKLTSKDHLYSNYPYGYKCLQTSTFFFNIVNQDDGVTWSTRWIVDDPKVYVATRPYSPQTAQVPTQPVSQTRPVTPPNPPATNIAAPKATTPAPVIQAPATTPATSAVPTAPAAPAAPATPATPALQAPQSNIVTPPLPSSELPTSTTKVDPKPASGLPALQTSPLPISNTVSLKLEAGPALRAKSTTQAAAPGSNSGAALPVLLTTPAAVTPTKAADVPKAPPALLPADAAGKDSEAVDASVISAPAPAPMALPVDEPPAAPAAEAAPQLPLLPPGE